MKPHLDSKFENILLLLNWLKHSHIEELDVDPTDFETPITRDFNWLKANMT